jgi:L-seryl-tRNA(Ser) seleniumtransferase
MSNVFRRIPSVNELLETQPLKQLISAASRSVVVDGVRDFLENMRSELQTAAGKASSGPVELAENIADWIRSNERLPLKPVINATGILLHTGLGRAPLPEAALQAMLDIGRGYASVELDLKTGERSQRVDAVAPLLRELTGAEAAVVVNNNAGATLLTLTAIGHGKEIIVSRGELVEIGGSFRLPEVMTSSGAILREVGATNKTRIADYRDAIGAETAALMRVHTSNYTIVGFTEQASLEELVQLGRQRHLPVIDDIGSGALHDLTPWGVPGEPLARESIRQGADLVLFSGDKLLGGPQCGIIVGKKTMVDRVAKHPMMRALRVDKLTLAALAATLRLHRDEEAAQQGVPLMRMLATPIENLKQRAERMAPQLAACPSVVSAEPAFDHTFLGGGSVPTQQIETWCVDVEPAGMGANAMAAELRAGDPAIVCRVQRDRLVIDLRAVMPSQDMTIIETLQQPASDLG